MMQVDDDGLGTLAAGIAALNLTGKEVLSGEA